MSIIELISTICGIGAAGSLIGYVFYNYINDVLNLIKES